MDCGAVLEYINGLPEAAVYSIVDENTKIVHCINHSTKFKSKLGEIASCNLIAGHNCKLEYFSISSHPVYKLIDAEKIRQGYLARGYKILTQTNPFIKFKAHIKIDTDHTNVLVYITSSRRHNYIVGVFKNMAAAQEFYNLNYSPGWGEVVFCNNDESRRFFNDRRYKQKLMPGAEYYLESSESDAER